MSETINDQNPSVANDLNTEQDQIVEETGAPNGDETSASYDDAASQDIEEKPTRSLITGFEDDSEDDDDDDGIQVTIGNYAPDTQSFQKKRPIPTTRPATIKGVDMDGQGVINGQPTFDHDIATSYKDDEKPWKKPGADISDYFNYGFTEETWTLYCDRQRRLRTENNLARMNVGHMMPPMMRGQAPMMHPMNPHPMMMMNMQMVPRPMNGRRPDGKIGVIGSTDQTSRRPMYDTPNNFERPPYMNGAPFPGNQPPGGQTVGDLIPSTGAPAHGNYPNNTHPIQTLGAQRLPMMNLPQYRPPYVNQQFFPRGPVAGMHGDRLPHPYFIPTHPPPGSSFPPQNPSTKDGENERGPSSRSPTPEQHRSPRSATPEETRANNNENDKSSKDRYRDHHRSSSSSKYRSHHRSNDHEYERPRNERDGKYDRHSRKRHEHESSRHHRSSEQVDDHHRKSSKRSRHDSEEDSHHRRRRSSSRPKKSTDPPASEPKSQNAD